METIKITYDNCRLSIGREVVEAKDIEKSIKKLIERFIYEWDFCKKANVEPFIHLRRVIEIIHKFVENELKQKIKGEKV